MPPPAWLPVMPSRRSLLAGAAAFVAGCSSQGTTDSEADGSPTPCPTGTPSPTPPAEVFATVAFGNDGDRPREVRLVVTVRERRGVDGPRETVVLDHTESVHPETEGQTVVSLFGPEDPKPVGNDETLLRAETATDAATRTLTRSAAGWDRLDEFAVAVDAEGGLSFAIPHSDPPLRACG